MGTRFSVKQEPEIRKIRELFFGLIPENSGWKAPVFTGSGFARLNRKICGQFRAVSPAFSCCPVPIPGYNLYPKIMKTAVYLVIRILYLE